METKEKKNNKRKTTYSDKELPVAKKQSTNETKKTIDFSDHETVRTNLSLFLHPVECEIAIEFLDLHVSDEIEQVVSKFLLSGASRIDRITADASYIYDSFVKANTCYASHQDVKPLVDNLMLLTYLPRSISPLESELNIFFRTAQAYGYSIGDVFDLYQSDPFPRDEKDNCLFKYNTARSKREGYTESRIVREAINDGETVLARDLITTFRKHKPWILNRVLHDILDNPKAREQYFGPVGLEPFRPFSDSFISCDVIYKFDDVESFDYLFHGGTQFRTIVETTRMQEINIVSAVEVDIETQKKENTEMLMRAHTIQATMYESYLKTIIKTTNMNTPNVDICVEYLLNHKDWYAYGPSFNPSTNHRIRYIKNPKSIEVARVLKSLDLSNYPIKICIDYSIDTELHSGVYNLDSEKDVDRMFVNWMSEDPEPKPETPSLSLDV